MKLGLCANREPHEGHPYDSATLGLFWCTGDPQDRQPFKAEMLRKAKGRAQAAMSD